MYFYVIVASSVNVSILNHHLQPIKLQLKKHGQA